MQRWLYGPEGYYTKLPSIGKKGDFYTSVSTSMFFGGTLGKAVVDLVQHGEIGPEMHVVEIGAHQGYMLADVIQFIYSLAPSLLETVTFTIIEPLEAARRAQKAYFSQAFGETVLVDIVPSLEAFTCKEAIVLSNELFDAFPCEVVKENRALHVRDHVPAFEPMDASLQAMAKTLEVEKGEIAVGFEAFAQSLSRACSGRCEVIAFDYGQSYARQDFSLRVYAAHQSHPFFELTPFAGEANQLSAFFGKSDITYDVNFAHLQRAMESAGFCHVETKTQSSALVDFGLMTLLEMLRTKSSEATYTQEAEKAKQLILPAFLGERFKMIRMRK
jgi:SAM-dependent MidA family methyltransferase